MEGLLKKNFAKSARHFYKVVSSPVGVKFLGGGINETCKFESCQGFFGDDFFWAERHSNGNLVRLCLARV